MEVEIERMQVLHFWFHDNVNKLIKMWVLFLKYLSDVNPNTLNVDTTQCSF